MPSLPAEDGEIRRAMGAGALLVAAGGVAGLLNLLFNVVVARGGGVDAYGAVGPLLTLVTVAGLLATGFQYGIARLASLSSRCTAALLRSAFRVVLPWVLLPVVLAALSWPLAGFLDLSSPVPVLVLAGLAAVSLAGAAVSGLLVGLRRFGVIAALGVGVAALRLGLGFFVGRGQAAVTVSVTASLLAMLVSFAAGLLVLTRTRGRPRPPGPAGRRAVGPEAGVGAAGVAGALIAGALWTAWGLPVLFARHSLTPTAAGDFAASQLLAGAIIWGTAPLVTAFFPTIARHGERAAIVWGEAATLLIALVGVVALTAAGPLLVAHVYGSAFRTSRPLLLALSASAAATTCATFACWAAVATRCHVRGVLVALGSAVGLELVWDGIVARGATTLAMGPLLALLLGGGALSLTVLFNQVPSLVPAAPEGEAPAPILRPEPVTSDP